MSGVIIQQDYETTQKPGVTADLPIPQRKPRKAKIPAGYQTIESILPLQTNKKLGDVLTNNVKEATMSEQTQATPVVQEATEKKPRKQRADKGKPRGPRKPKTEVAQ